MFRRREGFAPKLAFLVLRITLFVSRALGLLPFTLDAQARQLRRSTWLLVYGVTVNILLLFLLVLCTWYSAETGQEFEVFKRSDVLMWINVLIGLLGLIVSCGVHCITFSKSGQVLNIFNELLVLEDQHFGCLNVEDASKFNFYVIQKFMSTVGEVLGVLMAIFGMPEFSPSWLYVVLICITQFSLDLVVMHFLLAMLYIYRCVWLINRQLLSIVSRLRVDSLSDSSRIQLLVSLYVRLLALSKQLEATYKGQITLILTGSLSGNIVIIYFLIVYTVSMGQFSIPLLMFPFSLMVNMWEYWLIICACELTERTGRHTSTILKLFSDLEHNNVHIERSINEFTWLCSHRRFRFSLYGFISVNFQMGFRMIVATFTYLLCLVQFDFMNL
ncbi:putative gustatory receptor 22b [Drosophila subobscura]|uniref:putative gustatory receptor 22b n=1 Tax=Drosophila subobscura TaxID=7241 RepID=UPI00155B1FA2|nr:putative gustatory receptor 22b [Drosophila subobscura]